MNRFLNKKKGFTLIEMLVAMTIFVLFTGLILSSYLGVVRSLRSTEQYRVLYSESRHAFDTLTQLALKSRFYEPKPDRPSDVSTAMCVGGEDGFVFYSNDYLEANAVCFNKGANEDGTDGKIVIRKFVRETMNDGSFLKNYTFDSETNLHSSSIYVKSFDPKLFPETNPYTSDFEVLTHFHPKVTFTVVFAKKNSNGDEIKVDLRTTISSRYYD